MEKYNKDQNALSKELGTFGREWMRISRELDDVAVHWETMAEKLLPNYSNTPNQTTGCTQMKGSAASRGSRFTSPLFFSMINCMGRFW